MNTKYVSNITDLCSATRFTYTEGKAKGMDVVVLNNGVLSLYVMIDRGMDIFRLEHKGENIAFITKNGAVNPLYLGSEGNKFVSTFQGGFLFTCGLDNVMGPDVHNGNPVVQHGSLTYIPAVNVNSNTYEKDGRIFVSLIGELHYTSLFGNKLILKRSITLEYGVPHFDLKDEVINANDSEDEYMIMYHHNLGYPIFNKDSKLKVDSSKIDIIAPNSDISKHNQFDEPSPKKPEEVMIHTINKGSSEHVSLAGGNHKVSISWDEKMLPYMVQWKSLASHDYACGLEPAMSPYPKKVYKKIKAGEVHTYELHYDFE